MKFASGHALYSALKAEGFEFPNGCGDIEMSVPVDGAIRLHYNVLLSGEDLEKFGRAMQRLAKETK